MGVEIGHTVFTALNWKSALLPKVLQAGEICLLSWRPTRGFLSVFSQAEMAHKQMWRKVVFMLLLSFIEIKVRESWQTPFHSQSANRCAPLTLRGRQVWSLVLRLMENPSLFSFFPKILQATLIVFITLLPFLSFSAPVSSDANYQPSAYSCEVPSSQLVGRGGVAWPSPPGGQVHSARQCLLLSL